jgi:hypothetical protein
MAKVNITQYDTTPANNTDIDSVNIAEGCAPSGINNAIREVMAHLADLNAGNVALGTIKVDNIQIDANAITSTDSNGNISITPNGTGNVVFAEGDIMIGSTALSATAAELNAANNYVHPNHSGEVTSTADGATVIADNIVDEANLKISNAPVNGYMLTAQSGDTGGLTWAAAPGASSYIGKNVQVFTSTGTFTVPTSVTALKVTVIGGGGAGEKVTATNKKARGGGAGGCAIEWLTSLTPGASIAVTIGAGGTAGGDATAGDGGTSSFASYCSATGGQGGDTNSNGPSSGNQEIGHTGGAGSGGTFNFDGGYGGVNVRINTGYFGGNGGYPYPMSNHIAGAAQFQGPFTDLLGDTGSTSHFVGAYSDGAGTKLLAYKQDFAMPQVLGGRAGKGSQDAAGAAGAGYGTGGGGAAAESSGTKNGGAGAAGVCIVEW